jgi:hypothetical protein
MTIEQDKIQEDSQVAEDERTMREIAKMADSVCPIIQMTWDCPGNYEDKKMPLLDMKIWLSKEQEEQRISFEFYRKPMASRLLILARSALPSRTKRAALTQDAIRIMRNCSVDIPWERRAELLSDFSLRMKLSGYPARYRETVFQSALKAWERMAEEDRTGVRPLYRDRSWRKEERSREKERKKAGWFKQLGGQKSDFPLFCPASPGSRLAERWRRVAEEVRVSSGGLVRATVVEQAGVPLSALLVDPLPGGQDLCEEADCNPCRTGTTRRLSCHRSNLGGCVYNCLCMTCKEEDGRERVSHYHGRTSRCLYTRQLEHFEGLAKKKEDNPLYKHKELHHQGEDCQFTFSVDKSFRDTLSHQIYEGVCINRSPSTPGYLMNSRAEYEQHGVARLVVAQGL